MTRILLSSLLLIAFLFSTAFAQQPLSPLHMSVTPDNLPKNSTVNVLACWWFEGTANSYDIVDEHYFNIIFDHSLGTVNSIGSLTINEAADFNGASGNIVVSDPIAPGDFTVSLVGNKIIMERDGSTKQLKYASSVCVPVNITTVDATVTNFARFIANMAGASGKPPLTKITVN